MNLLVVEDETRIVELIRDGLVEDGWNTLHEPSGEAALARIDRERFDAVVLDVVLPGLSGLDVCRLARLRKVWTPIIMLTALDTTDDLVEGLEAGADDYLAKPFRLAELAARLRALIRRQGQFAERQETHLLSTGGIQVDTRSCVATVDGLRISLTLREQAILVLLLTHAGTALSRQRIMNVATDQDDEPTTNVVDVHISRLRKKLGRAGRLIQTVRGVGYRIVR
ncbi:MAG: response regulator transcription factor [Pseudomonadota bacterium]